MFTIFIYCEINTLFQFDIDKNKVTSFNQLYTIKSALKILSAIRSTLSFIQYFISQLSKYKTQKYFTRLSCGLVFKLNETNTLAKNTIQREKRHGTFLSQNFENRLLFTSFPTARLILISIHKTSMKNSVQNEQSSSRLQAPSASNERAQSAVTRWLATAVVFSFVSLVTARLHPRRITAVEFLFFSCVFRLGRDPSRFSLLPKKFKLFF